MAFRFDPISKRMVRPSAKRGYHAASNPQFLQSWLTADTNADSEIRTTLPRLRNLARSLERDNPYMKRFLYEWERGIVGPTGFSFQSKAADGESPDREAQRAIEQAFARWKQAPNCTVTGDMPYCEFKNLSERAIARDGNILIRLIRGFRESEFRFAIQLIEADHLDYHYNRAFADGTKIVMGKEVGAWGQPLAYHISGDHPGDSYSFNGRRYTRIPARDVIHRYYRERPEQTMGAPLVTTAITGLRHIEKYEEAEQIAARVSASSTVSIERDFEPGKPYDGSDATTEFDFDLEPGGVWDLGYGRKANLINPTHPNANYEEFRKGVLRGICSGLLTNYNIIGNDLEGVNYSSLREGKLNAKAIYQGFRALNIDREERPIFEAWLGVALTLDLIGLPLAKEAKFRAADWRGAHFDWVDPLKDSKGKENDLLNGFTSLRRVIADGGGDIEQIVKERAADKQLFIDAGLPIPDFYKSTEQIDRYGIGVRAGAITPNEDDEAMLRVAAGLPAMSAAVKAAWAADGGVRKPITLSSQAMTEAETAAVTDAKPVAKPSSAPVMDEDEDDEEEDDAGEGN